MFHLWGMDINDENLTIRRLWNFFNRLPYNSQTMGDIAGVSREQHVWSPELYMLANVVDAIQALDWHFIAANSKHPPRPPKRIERPETKTTHATKKKVWPGKTIVDKGVKNG